jgi:ribosome-binding factor A
LTVRQVPQLTIRLDDSIASGDRVLRLLHNLEAESAPPAAEPEKAAE